MPLTTDQQRAAEALAKLILDLHTHCDRLIWGQVQTLAAVQGGTLAAIYSIKSVAIGAAVGLIGALITVGLFLFSEKVRIERDMNIDVFYHLTSAMAKQLPDDFFRNMALRDSSFDRPFDISQPIHLHFPVPHEREYIPVRAWIFGRMRRFPLVRLGTILHAAVLGFIVLDIISIFAVPFLRP